MVLPAKQQGFGISGQLLERSQIDVIMHSEVLLPHELDITAL